MHREQESKRGDQESPGDEINRREEVWRQLKRVAFIRAGALGDLLVGLASLAEMPTFFPGAKVVLVGPRLWAEILSPLQFPFIEKILAIERKGSLATVFLPDGDTWVAKPGERPLHVELRSCDGAVNTNLDSFRYAFSLIRAGVGVRVGSAPAVMAWLYTHASPWFGKDPLLHERDAPLLILELAVAGLRRFFRLTAQNRRNLSRWLAASQLIAKWRGIGLPRGRKANALRAEELVGLRAGRYVLVNPTASRREKTWPPDLMFKLLLACEANLRERGLEFVVIGAPNESEWLREVAQDRFRIVQPSRLRDLQDILGEARALLTNGSSMQFMAGATRTPTLTIFGRGQPLVWGPVGPRDRVVRARFEREDEGSTFAGFATEVEAYRTISVSEVEKGLLELLASLDGSLTEFGS